MYEQLHKYFEEKTGINESDFSDICSYFNFCKVKKNEYLLLEGDVCKHNIFVNKGCLRIFSINEEGEELTRYFAFERKFGTALTSLIDQQPSFEYIQAIENTEILRIRREDFFDLVKNVPEVNFVYRDILEMAYITSQKRIYDLQGFSALDRLKWLMDHHPKILSRLSNKVVATYLGITPYTLSRLKAKI